MSCEVCKGWECPCNECFHGLRDRIAKLESLHPGWSEPPAAAGPVPPGYALAPGWEAYSPGRFGCGRCGTEVVTAGGDMAFAGPGALKYVCRGCAVEMGALVKVEPPAEQPVSPDLCGDVGPRDVFCSRYKGHELPHRGWKNDKGSEWWPPGVTPPPGSWESAEEEQPASAADEGCDCAKRNACPAYGCGGSGPSGEWFEGNEVVCDDCGVSLMVDSIEKCGAPNCLGESTFSVIPDESMSEHGEPPAPTQGAPAEPLSARIRNVAKGIHRETLPSLLSSQGALFILADEATALEARIADAERERDEAVAVWKATQAYLQKVEQQRDEALVSVKQAVAAERERCLAWAQSKHLVIQGGMSMEKIRDAIRDGRPEPK